MQKYPFENARDVDLIPPGERTLQDFRNELQEQSFIELKRMQMGAGTYTSNLINNLIDKLDWFYGTEYQVTQTEIKAKEEKNERADNNQANNRCF